MNLLKKVLVYVLIACLTVTCIPPMGAAAATDDDGLLLREYSDFAGKEGKIKPAAVDSSGLTHNTKFDGYIIEDGIDVSHHNGSVDWEKVKDDGVDFAIIRMAYRGYGSAGNIKTDDYAVENLEGAMAAGLKVGVYFFSQATTEAEAVEEAEYILNIVDGYAFDLPVVMDFEYTAKNDGGRLWVAKQNGMTDQQRTDVCIRFCETVEEAGYDAMVYADKNMLETDLIADQIDDMYEIWLAHWTSKTGYENDYTYWQYTSDGTVDGVPSARVDMNVRYVDPTLEPEHPVTFQPMTLEGKTVDAATVKLSWSKVEEADGYQLQYYNPYQKKYVITKRITDNNTLSIDRTGLAIGTSYTYRIRPFVVENGKSVYGTFSEPVTVTTAKTLKKPVLTAVPVSYTTNKLSWTKVPGATAYQIQKYNYAKKKWVFLKKVTGTSTTNTYLNCNTIYKYRVRAIATLNGKQVNSYYSVAKTSKTKGSRIGVVKEGPLNIRKGPGTGYKKLIQVKKGRQLTITGSTAKWYRVKIKVNGKFKVGYVSKTYVRLK